MYNRRKGKTFKQKSLTTRTIRTTVISCLLLGIIALLIGLSVYVSTMVQQYVRNAFETARHARMSPARASPPRCS